MNEWTLLIYKIPSQPSRLRLSIWRRLQRMGALYLQDAACLLPSRPDLDENMQYVAEAIAEMEGTYHLFSAKTVLPQDGDRVVADFRALADSRFGEIQARLEKRKTLLDAASTLDELEEAEEELKRERVAYLRAKRLSYFGSTKENEVEASLDDLRQRLDSIHRGSE